MVQRRKGLRLHHRGRLRRRCLRALVRHRRRRATAPWTRASGWSWKSARAKRARRPKASGPPDGLSRCACPTPGCAPCACARPPPWACLARLARPCWRLTGCAGPSGSARVTAADASGDGTLRVGLILDNTGPQNFLNAPQLAAARLAIKEINAAGGHKGKPVELLPETISQDTAAQATALVAAKADVVIGPTDSSRAPGRDRCAVPRQGGGDFPCQRGQRAQQVQERRLLLPHRGRRHRPGAGPRQARQGRRRQDRRRGA